MTPRAAPGRAAVFAQMHLLTTARDEYRHLFTLLIRVVLAQHNHDRIRAQFDHVVAQLEPLAPEAVLHRANMADRLPATLRLCPCIYLDLS